MLFSQASPWATDPSCMSLSRLGMAYRAEGLAAADRMDVTDAACPRRRSRAHWCVETLVTDQRWSMTFNHGTASRSLLASRDSQLSAQRWRGKYANAIDSSIAFLSKSGSTPARSINRTRSNHGIASWNTTHPWLPPTTAPPFGIAVTAAI